MTAVVVGADGVPRCGWAGQTPDYASYHDLEWGRPVRGEQALYERITLEAFQSGLSWLTILRKRPAFRTAFADFDPQVVAHYDEGDVQRLMTEPAIVRNQAKIRAAITNAGAVLALREQGGLDALVWSFAPPPRTARLGGNGDVPATTAASTALAKRLRQHGFAFVGPTTAYAAMQACGLVDDHVQGCHVSTG